MSGVRTSHVGGGSPAVQKKHISELARVYRTCTSVSARIWSWRLCPTIIAHRNEFARVHRGALRAMGRTEVHRIVREQVPCASRSANMRQ